MFEVRRPIENFRLLVLGVSFNTTLGGIHKNPWVTQTLTKKSLEPNPRKRNHFLALICVFVPTKADLIAKKWSYKRGMVDAGGASSIEMILAVLGLFSLACRFGTTGLSLKRKIHVEHCHCPKVFFGILDGSYDGDWTSCITWYEAPYLKESPMASWLLYSAECDGAFLREWKSGAIAMKQSNWASPNELADLLGLEKLEL